MTLLFTNIRTAAMHSITLRELVQLRLIVKLGVIDNFLYLGYILIREQWLRKLLREKEEEREQNSENPSQYEKNDVVLLGRFLFLGLRVRIRRIHESEKSTWLVG